MRQRFAGCARMARSIFRMFARRGMIFQLWVPSPARGTFLIVPLRQPGEFIVER